MTRVLRITGFLMILAGGLLAASWFIDPLRQMWPLLLTLPVPIRIGLVLAAIGLLVVLATVIHDRLTSDNSTLAEELGDDS